MRSQVDATIRVGGRGQAHTIEVALAALVLVSVTGVAIQAMPPAVATGPHATHEEDTLQRTVVVDLLETGATDGALLETVLYWDPVNGTVAGPTGDGSADTAVPSTEFGRTLERALGSRGLVFTLAVVYRTDDTTGTPTVERQPIVEGGVPSVTAVTASRVVTIPADASLAAPGFGDRTLDELDTASGFYAPSTGDGAVYASVEVELVVWRP